MKFACKCLNFLIDANGAAERVDDSTKKKLSGRANETEDLMHVTCESIVKKVDMLIGTISHDGWTEYYCRNCGVWMYCCRMQEDHNVPAIVNNATHVNEIDIENRKKDSKFSRIFKILIFNLEDMTSFTGIRTHGLENLHPVASSWLEHETTSAENLIKDFADQQYAELENKRMRAYSEQAALQRVVESDKRLIISPLKVKKTHIMETKLPMVAREGTPPPKTIDDLDLDESMMFESKTSFDSALSEASGDEEVDVPPARRLSEPMLARSLPIPVPQFLEERSHDDRHERSPQTPADIAANIRALARSVHGNPVFGDLPPPRFTKD